MLCSILVLLISVIFVQCAPKLGDVLFDPLQYEFKKSNFINGNLDEDDDFLENEPNLDKREASVIAARANDPPVFHAETTATLIQLNPSNDKESTSANNLRQLRDKDEKKDGGNQDSVKKSGYDYDENQCKTINGRILCGYNKNHGQIPIKNEAVPMPNGCQMRGERVECGYVNSTKPKVDHRFKADDELVTSQFQALHSNQSKVENTVIPLKLKSASNEVRFLADEPISEINKSITINNFIRPQFRATLYSKNPMKSTIGFSDYTSPEHEVRNIAVEPISNSNKSVQMLFTTTNHDITTQFTASLQNQNKTSPLHDSPPEDEVRFVADEPISEVYKNNYKTAVHTNSTSNKNVKQYNFKANPDDPFSLTLHKSITGKHILINSKAQNKLSKNYSNSLFNTLLTPHLNYNTQHATSNVTIAEANLPNNFPKVSTTANMMVKLLHFRAQNDQPIGNPSSNANAKKENVDSSKNYLGNQLQLQQQLQSQLQPQNQPQLQPQLLPQIEPQMPQQFQLQGQRQLLSISPSVAIDKIEGGIKNEGVKVIQTEADLKVLENIPLTRIADETIETPQSKVKPCSTCPLRILEKGVKGNLRDLPNITTPKCATRCVEIGDRIVCYPVKNKSTTPLKP